MTSDHYIRPLATNNDTYIILLGLFQAGYNSCLPHDSEYYWGTLGESEIIRHLDLGWDLFNRGLGLRIKLFCGSNSCNNIWFLGRA